MGIEVIALGALAVAGGSAVYQASQAEDAEDAQYAANEEAKRQSKIQNDYQRRVANIQNARQIRDMVRQNRIRRASIVSTATNRGVGGASGPAGATGSLGSQMYSEIGTFQGINADQQATAGSIFESQSRQIDAYNTVGAAQANMATAGAIGNLAGTVFGAAGGFETVFKE